jgi:low temperature requirement protein LtrA
MTSSRSSLLRERGPVAAKVTMVELFFDLVFVFAVTQLSHTLRTHLTATGVFHTTLLFLAVWWSWIYTSWITNWLDPDRPTVRLLLFALMLGGLLMSSVLPDAFAEHGLMFAVVFAVTQVGRSLFMLPVLYGVRPTHFRNFVRITLWTAVSATLWITGGVASGDRRIAAWVAALAIEYVGPVAFFWVPVMGRSTSIEWDIDGAHMAERCALFVIIALGESILVTGATFAQLPQSAESIAGLLLGFGNCLAMWWIYFDTGHERGAHRIVHGADPGRQARLAYTYIHLLIVAGIVVSAVGNELVLTDRSHRSGAAPTVLLAGPGLYILGNGLFKWVSNDRRTPPLSHLIGLVLLASCPAIAARVSVLSLGMITTGALIVVATWETVALRRPARP